MVVVDTRERRLYLVLAHHLRGRASLGQQPDDMAVMCGAGHAAALVRHPVASTAMALQAGSPYPAARDCAVQAPVQVGAAASQTSADG